MVSHTQTHNQDAIGGSNLRPLVCKSKPFSTGLETYHNMTIKPSKIVFPNFGDI